MSAKSGHTQKGLGEWTRAEFEALPSRKRFDSTEPLFDGLVIIPQRQCHDSGYRFITVVAVLGDKPVCKLTECSDVIHFDGIGGYGEWSPPNIPRTLSISAWDMDFLKASGLPRIWCNGKVKVGAAVSSFSIYAKAAT